MSRKSEIKTEETAVNSPLRRSTRRHATTALENTDKDEKVEAKPAARGRRASISKDETESKPEPAKTRGRRSSASSEPPPEETTKTQIVTRRRRSTALDDLPQSEPVKTVRNRKNSASEKPSEEELAKKSTRTRKGSEEPKEEPVKKGTRSRRGSVDKAEEVESKEKKPTTRGRRSSTDKLETDAEQKPIKLTPIKSRRRPSVTENTPILEPIEETESEAKRRSTSPVLKEPVQNLPVSTNLNLSIIEETSFIEETKKDGNSEEKEATPRRSPRLNKVQLAEKSESPNLPKNEKASNTDNKENKESTKDVKSKDENKKLTPIKLDFVNNAESQESGSDIINEKTEQNDTKNSDTKLSIKDRSNISIGSDGSFQCHLNASISDSHTESGQEKEDDLNSSRSSSSSDKENINIDNPSAVKKGSPNDKELLDTLTKVIEGKEEIEVVVSRVSNVFRPGRKEPDSFMEPMEVDETISETNQSSLKLEDSSLNLENKNTNDVESITNKSLEKESVPDTENASGDDSFHLRLSISQKEKETESRPQLDVTEKIAKTESHSKQEDPNMEHSKGKNITVDVEVDFIDAGHEKLEEKSNEKNVLPSKSQSEVVNQSPFNSKIDVSIPVLKEGQLDIKESLNNILEKESVPDTENEPGDESFCLNLSTNPKEKKEVVDMKKTKSPSQLPDSKLRSDVEDSVVEDKENIDREDVLVMSIGPFMQRLIDCGRMSQNSETDTLPTQTSSNLSSPQSAKADLVSDSQIEYSDNIKEKEVLDIKITKSSSEKADLKLVTEPEGSEMKDQENTDPDDDLLESLEPFQSVETHQTDAVQTEHRHKQKKERVKKTKSISNEADRKQRTEPDDSNAENKENIDEEDNLVVSVGPFMQRLINSGRRSENSKYDTSLTDSSSKSTSPQSPEALMNDSQTENKDNVTMKGRSKSPSFMWVDIEDDSKERKSLSRHSKSKPRSPHSTGESKLKGDVKLDVSKKETRKSVERMPSRMSISPVSFNENSNKDETVSTNKFKSNEEEASSTKNENVEEQVDKETSKCDPSLEKNEESPTNEQFNFSDSLRTENIRISDVEAEVRRRSKSPEPWTNSKTPPCEQVEKNKGLKRLSDELEGELEDSSEDSIHVVIDQSQIRESKKSAQSEDYDFKMPSDDEEMEKSDDVLLMNDKSTRKEMDVMIIADKDRPKEIENGDNVLEDTEIQTSTPQEHKEIISKPCVDQAKDVKNKDSDDEKLDDADIKQEKNENETQIKQKEKQILDRSLKAEKTNVCSETECDLKKMVDDFKDEIQNPEEVVEESLSDHIDSDNETSVSPSLNASKTLNISESEVSDKEFLCKEEMKTKMNLKKHMEASSEEELENHDEEANIKTAKSSKIIRQSKEIKLGKSLGSVEKTDDIVTLEDVESKSAEKEENNTSGTKTSKKKVKSKSNSKKHMKTLSIEKSRSGKKDEETNEQTTDLSKTMKKSKKSKLTETFDSGDKIDDTVTLEVLDYEDVKESKVLKKKTKSTPQKRKLEDSFEGISKKKTKKESDVEQSLTNEEIDVEKSIKKKKSKKLLTPEINSSSDESDEKEVLKSQKKLKKRNRDKTQMESPKLYTKPLKKKARSKEEWLYSKLDEFLQRNTAQIENDSDTSSEEYEPNEFVSTMAEEAEEDTPSEDSNQIIDEGESIHSTDTEQGSNADDEYDVGDSFICDDEEEELLSGNEYDLGDEKKKKKKKSRIIQLDEYDDEVFKLPKKEKVEPVKKRSRIIIVSDTDEDEKISLQDSSSEESQQERIVNQELICVEEKGDDELIIVKTKEISEESTQALSLNTSSTTEQRPKRRVSSITIHENINVKDIKDGPLSERISTIVDSFCTTVNKGEISLNLSIECHEKENEGSEEKVEMRDSRKIKASTSSSGPEESRTQPRKLSISMDDIHAAGVQKKAQKRRKLSQSMDNLTEIDVKKRKKNKKKKAEQKKTSAKIDLLQQSSSLINKLVTDVKNRPRRMPKPSTSMNSSWIAEVADVKPSTTAFDRQEKAAYKAGKVHPKDFRSQLLNDPSRVKRIDTKKLLKKRGVVL